jgi:PAS domain S-box-containing protein
MTTLQSALEPTGPQHGEVQFRQFLESVPILAWRSFPDGAREFHTRHWLEFTGLTESDAKGWGWLNAVHPDDSKGLMRAWEAIRVSGQAGTLDNRLKRFDGVYRWVTARIQPYFDSDGRIESWYGCCKDIDERKHAEESLRRGEHELNAIMDEIAELISVISPEDKLLYANRHYRAYTGADVADVTSGRFRSMVLHPDELEAMSRDR